MQQAGAGPIPLDGNEQEGEEEHEPVEEGAATMVAGSAKVGGRAYQGSWLRQVDIHVQYSAASLRVVMRAAFCVSAQTTQHSANLAAQPWIQQQASQLERHVTWH